MQALRESSSSSPSNTTEFSSPEIDLTALQISPRAHLEDPSLQSLEVKTALSQKIHQATTTWELWKTLKECDFNLNQIQSKPYPWTSLQLTDITQMVIQQGSNWHENVRTTEKPLHLHYNGGKGEYEKQPLPASFVITTSGNIYIHHKGAVQDERGSFKKAKDAILFDRDHHCRWVKRLVCPLFLEPNVPPSKQKSLELLEKELEQEIERMRALSGGNQVVLHDAVRTTKKDGRPVFILYVERFDCDFLTFLDAQNKLYSPCFSFLREKIKSFSKEQMYFQLIRSLKELHAKGISVSDMKPENILLLFHPFFRVVFTDFGGTIEKEKDRFSSYGLTTSFYIPPEKRMATQEKKPWTFEEQLKADIWALGKICLMISEPYIQKYPNFDFLPPIPQDKTFKDVLFRMLNSDPNQRPTLEEIETQFLTFYPHFREQSDLPS